MTPQRSEKGPKPVRRAPAPSEVAPGIFVGGWKEAEGFEGTRICVLDERPPELERWAGATHVPIYDGEKDAPIVENLDRVADLVHAAHARGEPVVVFCGHGVRRGSLGGAWYLHRYEKLSLDRAFDRVAAVRPQIERPQEWMGHSEQLEERTTPKSRGGRKGDA